MIFIAIINTIYAVVYIVLSPIRALPDVTLPANFNTAISSASGYITPLNALIPIDTLIQIISLIVVIELSYFTYKFIMWLIKRLPTQS